MTNEDFKKVLEEWIAIEKEFKKELEDTWMFLEVYSAPCQAFEYYDLFWIDKYWDIFTFEVKSGINATKSVFIETWSKWVESGLKTTKADYYVYKLLDWFYFIPVKHLKEAMKSPCITYRPNVGYKWLSAGYVVPINEFKNIFKVWKKK